MAEYELFIDDISALKQGEPVELFIRDTDQYEAKYVKAVVADSRDKLPEGEVLWLRYTRGLKRPQPWYIKIVQELEGLPMVEGPLG